MMYIFKWKNPISLQEYQFDVEADSDTEILRKTLFAKLEQLEMTGNFPVKVITNYGTKVWMVHHTVSRRFVVNGVTFAGDTEGWKQLQCSSARASCYLMDTHNEFGIDIDGCSAELAIKLLNDGHTLTLDHVITFREVNSYSVAYEI